MTFSTYENKTSCRGPKKQPKKIHVSKCNQKHNSSSVFCILLVPLWFQLNKTCTTTYNLTPLAHSPIAPSYLSQETWLLILFLDPSGNKKAATAEACDFFFLFEYYRSGIESILYFTRQWNIAFLNFWHVLFGYIPRLLRASRGQQVTQVQQAKPWKEDQSHLNTDKHLNCWKDL